MVRLYSTILSNLPPTQQSTIFNHQASKHLIGQEANTANTQQSSRSQGYVPLAHVVRQMAICHGIHPLHSNVCMKALIWLAYSKEAESVFLYNTLL